MNNNPSQKTILIASSDFDKRTWEPVATLLREDGYEPIVYKADEIAQNKDSLQIDISPAGHLEMVYSDKRIVLSSVDAAWCRRPAQFTHIESDPIREQTLFREINSLQQAMWAEIPEGAWLNAPSRMVYAERKITQLVHAKQIGFRIPMTLISNTWESILAQLPEKIIVKSSCSVLGAGTDMSFVFSTPFTNTPQKLPLKHGPFPGVWQQQLTDKAREWRITVVGNTVFCAAIYTDAFAKDDWRKHQNTSGVRFERGEFPLALQKKCRKYLRAFGLRFGAFDFVEDSQGNITFLECNTNGQFGWLEDQLNLPISRAIADELEKIANGRG